METAPGGGGGGELRLTPIEVIQRAGELLFVPSGWYHQVENIDDCISINHNWLNGCNADWALRRLSQTLDDVNAPQPPHTHRARSRPQRAAHTRAFRAQGRPSAGEAGLPQG